MDLSEALVDEEIAKHFFNNPVVGIGTMENKTLDETTGGGS